MAKVYVVVVLCCLKALPPSRQCPRRHLRVVVEEVLWDEFDCSVAVIAGGCFGNLIDTQPWRRYLCRCSFFQIRSSDLRNSPPLCGRARSRLQKTLLIHHT